MYAKTVRHSNRKRNREKKQHRDPNRNEGSTNVEIFLNVFFFLFCFLLLFYFQIFFFLRIYLRLGKIVDTNGPFFCFICIRWISIEDFTLLLLLKWCFRFGFSFSSSALIFEVGETYCIVICLWLAIIAHTHTSASNYISEYLWVFTAINIS